MSDSKFSVFVGWSGDASKSVASALWGWLPDVLQPVEPWISSEDIAKGARWTPELAERLNTARFGIFCLTPENLDSLWIPFEAGCLSRDVEKDRICPYLFQVPAASTPAPLIQFQVTEATEADTRKMIHSINKSMGDLGFSPELVARAFDRLWPELKAQLERVRFTRRVMPAPEPPPAVMLSEILETVRGLARRPGNVFDMTMQPEVDPPRGAIGVQGASGPRSRFARSPVPPPPAPEPPWTGEELAEGFKLLSHKLGSANPEGVLAEFLVIAMRTPRSPNALEAIAASIGRREGILGVLAAEDADESLGDQPGAHPPSTPPT